MKLEELIVYNLAMEIGEEIWDIVDKWTIFWTDGRSRKIRVRCQRS